MVCGAATGMFMLAGLHNGSATPRDNEGKMANYAFVQRLAGDFKAQYGMTTAKCKWEKAQEKNSGNASYRRSLPLLFSHHDSDVLLDTNGAHLPETSSSNRQ